MTECGEHVTLNLNITKEGEKFSARMGWAFFYEKQGELSWRGIMKSYYMKPKTEV